VTTLSKDVFLSLAAIAWADGSLDPDEADGIVRAAVDEGLAFEDIEAIDAATKNRIDTGVLDRSGMSKEDRLFVFAVASWIAKMDGSVTDEEAAALGKLGDQLGIPEKARDQARRIAEQVAAMPEGDRPARFDLAAVRRIIGERLRRADEARAKGGAA
jgi:tellurite resistance protein